MAASVRQTDALRILFCGCDHFSVTSLRALTRAQREVPGLVHSIDVAHRPAKPTGRGLKTWKELPISHAAKELQLATHAFDTFTGWEPPGPIDLIVAVSFGLFVPPRILGLAKYGGINVHPSLLPDLRGPAPIQHAILKRRKFTGVSVQTLHPEHFDQGTILAQTTAPGIQLSKDTTAAALEEQLAHSGAQLLVDVLKSEAFVPPHTDVGWYADSKGQVEHAPKITKQDRHIDFRLKSMEYILAVQCALGNLWCTLPNGDRLIMHKVADTGMRDTSSRDCGIWIEDKSKRPLFRTPSGEVGVILESTYAGNKTGHGNAKLLHVFPGEQQKDPNSNVEEISRSVL